MEQTPEIKVLEEKLGMINGVKDSLDSVTKDLTKIVDFSKMVVPPEEEKKEEKKDEKKEEKKDEKKSGATEGKADETKKEEGDKPAEKKDAAKTETKAEDAKVDAKGLHQKLESAIKGIKETQSKIQNAKPKAAVQQKSTTSAAAEEKLKLEQHQKANHELQHHCAFDFEHLALKKNQTPAHAPVEAAPAHNVEQAPKFKAL